LTAARRLVDADHHHPHRSAYQRRRASHDRHPANAAVLILDGEPASALDGLRDERGLSKAELARQIGKNPANVRRTLTAPGNPELRTIIAMADALGAEIKIVRRRWPAAQAA
jgi:ribosome-binding protein aMBF1 (putative translation factor)